ncbi:MAG: hypothetical protein AB7L13_12035 [Acidimicrobiia bacterium]
MIGILIVSACVFVPLAQQVVSVTRGLVRDIRERFGLARDTTDPFDVLAAKLVREIEMYLAQQPT